MPDLDCDVLILGAGMAGSCLARQLRLQEPDLRVILVDRKTEFDWWVGESTVEAWEDYMVRVLRLGPMLEKHFIVKHGQRFFFDSARKDLPVARMSELGRTGYHPLSARQIDRTVFDRLMIEGDRGLGVKVLLGVAVPDEPDAIVRLPKGGHRVSTTAGSIRCRWLVDACGRSSPLARKHALVDADPRHEIVSYWSRFEGAVPIDELGDDAWRRRVRHTSRWASTNHFMYRGYWIWLIPVTDRIVSVGVVARRDMGFPALRDGAALERFLRSHRALDQALGGDARRLDFMGLTRLPRCARTRFSTDRWFLAGMSGHFFDALGSGTSRLYAETNRMIGALIRADREGDERRYRARAKHFDLYLRRAYEASIRDLGDYRRQGCFDLWSVYYAARLASYFNSRLPLATSDLSTLVETADRHGPECACAFDPSALDGGFGGGLRRLADGFREFVDARGLYHAGNRDRFEDLTPWEQRPVSMGKVYEPPDARLEESENRAIYAECARRLAARAAELAGGRLSPRDFSRRFDPDWASGQTLADLAPAAAVPPRRRGAVRR